MRFYIVLCILLSHGHEGRAFMPLKSPATRSRMSRRTSPARQPPPRHRSGDVSCLHSTSAAVGWAVGHVVGGSVAAPIVGKAIKSWYKKISLPSWTPPDRIFAPVWTLLYSMMGVSAYRVYQQVEDVKRSTPMILWAVHYLLNLTWAPVFFGWKRLRAGLFINCLLVGTLGWILPEFYALDQIAAYLLAPYVIWLLFATYLNYDICKRNPGSYNEAMFQEDLAKLQKNAAKYAGIFVS